MGGSLWTTSLYDWATGKSSYCGLKDKKDKSKEARVFELVEASVRHGKPVDVFYEVGRYTATGRRENSRRPGPGPYPADQ